MTLVNGQNCICARVSYLWFLTTRPDGLGKCDFSMSDHVTTFDKSYFHIFGVVKIVLIQI